MVGPMATNKLIKSWLEHKLISLNPASNLLQSSPASVSIVSMGSPALASASSAVTMESVAHLAHRQTATTTTPEVHPLLPLNPTPSIPSTSTPPTPTSTISHRLPSMQSNSSHRLPSMQSNSSQHSFFKKLTLASTQTIHSSAESLTSIAEDRILGRGKFVADAECSRRLEYLFGRLDKLCAKSNLKVYLFMSWGSLLTWSTKRHRIIMYSTTNAIGL
jgi:hypothetical protein